MMSCRRPVSATATGSNSAHSMNTLVVSSVLPVASPPITPASDCTPAASAMTQSSGPACSRGRSARGTLSPAPGRKVSTPPCTRSASNTCSGRPRSMVKKLVMSTSALIGRRPMERSRRCSQSGLGPFRTPRTVRPSTQRQAGRVDAPADRGGEPAPHRRRRPGRQRAQPGGRQVPRHAAHGERVAAVGRDRDLDHRVVQPGERGIGHADGASAGRSAMPSWSSPNPISR